MGRNSALALVIGLLTSLSGCLYETKIYEPYVSGKTYHDYISALHQITFNYQEFTLVDIQASKLTPEAVTVAESFSEDIVIRVWLASDSRPLLLHVADVAKVDVNKDRKSLKIEFPSLQPSCNKSEYQKTSYYKGKKYEGLCLTSIEILIPRYVDLDVMINGERHRVYGMTKQIIK